MSGPPGIAERVGPRPVFCITADVHNDRAVADGVCEGRFTHAGVTLDLGTEPDWLGAQLPADEEWRIEWNKFYYGLDLANAFRDTGDVRYLHVWESLVRSWTRAVDVGRDASDVAARRMQNWTYAWSMFESSPSFPGLREGLAEEILESIEEHTRFVRGALTPGASRNHRTLELYSLFVTALAFPSIDPRSELLELTIEELHKTLLQGFWSDGVHRECSTHYHLVALRSLVGARENARLFALDLPREFDAYLERACEFALHCRRPDGVVPALSDADNAAYPEVLTLAASLFDRPDFLFAGSEGAKGSPPTECNADFPDGGYFTQRSGWGKDDRFLIFDCGPLGDGGHGHYDLLNVEVFAGGRPLLVDPGRYTYSEDQSGEDDLNLRHWFKGTGAHNTVCVDGMDQTPYRRGRPGKKIAAHSFRGRRTAPGFDVIEGRAESPSYDAVHTRRVLFVAGEYWIVEDRLEAASEHRFDLRWHLHSDAWRATAFVGAPTHAGVSAPGVVLCIAGGVSVRLERGWVAPTYGTKLPAPVVNVAADGREARFITLVAPVQRGTAAPRFRVTSDYPGASPVTSVEVEAGDGRHKDVVAWSGSPARMTLGPIECVASAAWVRESPSGTPLSFKGFDIA